MLLGFTLAVLSFIRFSVNAATICNGYAELCNRGYGNITYVGAHNSYAVGINNPAANQERNITLQLNDGVRLLQMQAHENSGDIYLCHTDCGLLNGGTLLDYLKTVKTWMDAHPEDVVTLLIVNSDNLPATQFASVFVAAGVDTLSLIDAGTRLVTFLSTTADFETVPYLIDEFSNIWETPFDTIDKTAFQCVKDRGTGDISTSMFLINHFLDILLLGNPIPDVTNANLTNAASGPGSLGEEMAICAGLYDRYPNFLLVDYYQYGGGSVFQVAATANSVTYTGTISPSPSGSQVTGSGSSGGGVSSSFGMTTILAIGCVTLGAFSVFV